MDMAGQNKLVVFEDKEIRHVWFKNEWRFSVSDIIESLTHTTDVRQYIKKMRRRDPELNNNWGTICTPLKMVAKDGKNRKVNAANTEGVFSYYSINIFSKSRTFQKISCQSLI